MEQWITEVMSDFGYLGVFLLIGLENLFPPIPSEVILTFAGFMTTNSDLTVIGVIIAATLGSVIGALALYAVGRLLDVTRLERIVERWGHILRLKKEDIRKADAWFDKYGIWTVFFCRLIPLIRSLISIPAGMSRMKIVPFLLLTVLGSVIWNTILVYLGSVLGDSWETIVEYMDVYSNVAYALIAVIALAAAGWFIKTRFLKKNK
ncbi:DedA family protein [Paenibacillus thailandensis]|uniref:DedA family protein n=1 Tax=Paenibacillus thailandensis TaxID=393250 RepID=A0ABW5R510_9BACL